MALKYGLKTRTERRDVAPVYGRHVRQQRPELQLELLVLGQLNGLEDRPI